MLLKKGIAAIAAVSIMAALSINASAIDFTDVSGHWAEETINVLADKGIVNGVTNTEFVPEGEVTRAQYLKMIMEALGVEPVAYRNGECLEATADEWYGPYLQKALDIGLIPDEMIAGCKKSVEYEVDESGKATSSKLVYSGAFNGNLPITREEMAVLTQGFYQYTRTILTNTAVDLSQIADFADQEEIDDWAQMSIKQAVANGFIDGMDYNMFKPKDSATRAQAATIIFRVISK